MIVSNDSIPVEDVVKATCEIGSYIFWPLHNSKYVAKYFDAHGFKHGIQDGLKSSKKSINKKTICYISDNCHSDIVYADFLNLIISYPEERSIFKEKEYIEKLTKLFKNVVNVENKENSKSPRTIESETQLALETKVLEHINDNLVIVINISTLQNYYQWVSLYPNIEKLCSTRFLNDSAKNKEVIFDKNNKGNDDLENVPEVCNFMIKTLKDFVAKKLTKLTDDEDLKVEDVEIEGEIPSFPIKEDVFGISKEILRTSGRLSKDQTNETIQLFKNPSCLNQYPKPTQITAEYFSEARFKNFITTYNMLLVKVKSHILKTKNLNMKYKSNCERIMELYQKKGLVRDTYNLSSDARQQLANLASLNERIEELHAEIKEKEAMIKLKEKLVNDKSQIKKALNNEIQASIDEKMDKLSQVLQSIERLDDQDMMYVAKTYDHLSEHEKQLVEVLINILYLKQVPDSKFQSFASKVLTLINDKSQLVSILRARRDTVFTENVSKKVKQFTQKYGSEKYDKPIFKLLAKFLSSLVKKFNLKVLLEGRYEKLDEINQILVQAELNIAYYKSLIEDKKEELEDLLIKQRNSGEDIPKSKLDNLFKLYRIWSLR